MKITPPSFDKTTIPNYLAALVMAVVVVLLFTPFWHFGEGETAEAVSINSYVWYPGEQGNLEAYFEDALGAKVDIDSVIVAPIILLVFGFIGAVLCVLKADKKVVSLFPIVVGIAGIYGFATVPVLRLGSTWGLMLALCIGMLALGLASLLQEVFSKNQ